MQILNAWKKGAGAQCAACCLAILDIFKCVLHNSTCMLFAVAISEPFQLHLLSLRAQQYLRLQGCSLV